MSETLKSYDEAEIASEIAKMKDDYNRVHSAHLEIEKREGPTRRNYKSLVESPESIALQSPEIMRLFAKWHLSLKNQSE